jgi:hypothetical protein
MATQAVDVQAVASAGAASAGNNDNADILVLVTDESTGAGVTTLAQADFEIVDHFSLPGQHCGFSSHITAFNNVGTGAYQIQVATHATLPPPGGCTWVKGKYLGQVVITAATVRGQAAFTLSIA